MKKLQQIQQYLCEHGVDAAFITTPDNIFYLSGFQSDPHERLLGIMVFQQAEPFIICPFMEIPDVKETRWQYDVVGHRDTEDAWEVVQKAVQQRMSTLQSLAIEKGHLSVERYERIQALFPNSSISAIDDHINLMRNIKSAEELEHLRKAAALADYAVEVGCQEIAEGKTELDIISAIEYALKQRGAEKMAFDTLVLSGPKTASPHGKPGLRKIQQGDFVLFDLGVSYNGYVSDITRTVAFGEPSEDMRIIYETVKKAQQASIDVVQPGVKALEVDRAARDVIENAGYGEYFTHRIGHGLGISVHEYPSLTATNELPLAEGMVFTIEPGIYHPDITGVRIEDDVAVTSDGVEVLSQFPKELIVIQPK